MRTLGGVVNIVTKPSKLCTVLWLRRQWYLDSGPFYTSSSYTGVGKKCVLVCDSGTSTKMHSMSPTPYSAYSYICDDHT